MKSINRVGRLSIKGLLFLMLITFWSDCLNAQDYEFSLRQRRKYDKIDVEIWAKSLKPNPKKLGYASLVLKYNSIYLKPSVSQTLSMTDSIASDVDQLQPVKEILSQFSSANGYSSLKSRSYGEGKFSLEITLVDMENGGISPFSDGRGSFIGKLSFDIVNSPKENDSTGINWNKNNLPGDIRVFASDSTDIESIVSLKEHPKFTVLGVTILSPNFKGNVIDRDHDYVCLKGDYAGGGYPIYFERSVDPILYPSDSEDLAYQIDYSLNQGLNWFEVGRFAVVNVSSVFGNESQYRTGSIFNPGTTSSYFVTTHKGEKLTEETFRQPLRVIWDKNLNYTLRSEQASIKITQMQGMGNTDLLQRKKTNIIDMTDNKLVLGRLFFVQLNGDEQFIKTKENVSNSTQLTVEAWVNLNEYNGSGSNPGIILSSGGIDATPVLGSKEGSWMLYLKDGKHPAFRVREILGRGTNGYLASLVAWDTLTVQSDIEPLQDAHSTNWAHLAATVKDNEVSLYMNGELVAKDINMNATDIRMLTTNHPIWIGANANIQPMDYLHAGIKGVRVWRTALSSDQIRERVAGIIDPTQIDKYDDVKKGLDLYYNLEGSLKDLASDSTFQKGHQAGNYFNSNLMDNNNIKYRPDRPHLTITSPAGGVGVKNKENDIHNVRWVSYGLGDIVKSESNDVVIEYSINGGETWTMAKSPANETLGGALKVDVEKGQINWEPYDNNDPLANLRSISPYYNNALLRIRGTEENTQQDLVSVTSEFKVAPHFSLKRGLKSIIEIPGAQGMNIVGSNIFLEGWIRPYQLPSTNGDFMPILAKIDSTNKKMHYMLSINRNGQLKFSVEDINGNVRNAFSDINEPLVRPNSIAIDTAWTHYGVLLNTNNGVGQSEIRFYIDGKPQRADSIVSQLGENLKVNLNNKYPTFIGYYPGKDTVITWMEQAYDSLTGDPLMDDDGNPVLIQKWDTTYINNKAFIGQMRDLRFWNGVPNNEKVSGDEPTNLTLFVQGAMAIVGDKLDPTRNTNLYASISMDGGGYIVHGYNRALGSTLNSAVTARCWNELFVYEPVRPYTKLVEPKFKQIIPNTDTSLRVRWVGFEYNGTDYTGGRPSTTPSLEFSTAGGGGSQIQPYQYVGSTYWNGNDINALTFPDKPQFVFTTGTRKIYFAGNLNVSLADPDENNDENTGDQGPLSASLTSARLRLTSFYTINSSTKPFQTEGPLFTITPASNFTIRTLLEGYHNGFVQGNVIRELGKTYDEGGLKITLYKDNSGGIGELAGTAQSIEGYDELDPKNRNSLNNRFANVNFVFTDLNDGNYWVLVEHINHLPIMSRYAAPFKYLGDERTTWRIESGWDFSSWNGADNNVLKDVTHDPWMLQSFTARGNAVSTMSNPLSSSTGLIFNNGVEGSNPNSMAAMVGGDAQKDGEINAADRIRVRLDEGTGMKRSDITGDGFVNADDRTIVDRNFGMISSVYPADLGALKSVKIDPTEYISNLDFGMSSWFVSNYNSLGSDRYIVSKDKNKENLQSAYSFKCWGDVINHDEYIDVKFYIQSTGSTFSMANSTFALEYNTDAVKFAGLLLEENVIFDGYDGGSVDSVDNNGYGKISYAPKEGTINQIDGVHSIEVNYDAAWIGNGTRVHKFPGLPVPTEKTYLGTMRFKIIDKKGATNFAWSPSTSVHSVNNGILTPYGDFEKFENFKLYDFVLTTPNGGEVYSEKGTYKAKWATDGKDFADIELSADGGASWTKLNADPVLIAAKEFTWVAPDVKSTRCKIRLVTLNDRTVLDESDDNFTIMANMAKITKPAAIDAPYKGGDKSSNIEWIAAGYNEVRFDFTSDLGKNWNTIVSKVDATEGRVNWNVPVITTKEARIRMIDVATGKEIAISDIFRIVSGTIIFKSPKAAEVIKNYEDYNVRWIPQNVDKFDMQITIDGGLNWYAASSNKNVKDVDASARQLMWDAPTLISKNVILRAIYPGEPTMELGRTPVFELVGNNSIDDMPNGYSLSTIFPNPTDNEFNLNYYFTSPEVITIEIISSDGKVVETLPTKLMNQGDGSMSINVANYPSGSYLLYISSENIKAIRKFTIKK